MHTSQHETIYLLSMYYTKSWTNRETIHDVYVIEQCTINVCLLMIRFYSALYVFSIVISNKQPDYWTYSRLVNTTVKSRLFFHFPCCSLEIHYWTIRQHLIMYIHIIKSDILKKKTIVDSFDSKMNSTLGRNQSSYCLIPLIQFNIKLTYVFIH